MKKVIQFSLKNKFAVWLLTIIITIAGLYSGLNMKLETIPNITMPVVSVLTVYPGATPEEVADKITEPIEKKIQNHEGVSVVSSSSFQNASSIQIQYEFEKDMEKAQAEVKEAVDSMTFPEGVQESQVSRLSFDAFPVMSLSISNESKSLADLTKQVEEEIVPTLEGLNGVASIQVSGQQLEEASLTFKSDKLKELGLSEETVQNMIKGANVQFPLGLFTFRDTQKSVVIDGNIATIEDLKKVKIPITPSQQGMTSQPNAQGMSGANQQQGAVPANIEIPTVTLGEIADVKIVGKAESISRTNGETSIGIQVVKASDANTVEVVNEVKKEIKALEKSYDGINIVSIYDQGGPIEKSVETMLSKAVFGAIFAMIIILLFLRNIRTTIISVVSIPLSLLIAILLLKQMDITLNIMTLGAMTVAIGRVIDDSIVVIENIFRRMSLKNEKLSGKELIVDATREMFMPIMSSTIVTIAVFLPLGLVKGTIGEMFLPFALTIVFSLLASLLVAITIVPMMAHSLFKNGVKGKQHDEESPTKLGVFYKKVLKWSLNHKLITWLITIALLIGSLFLVPVIGVSFLPSDEQKMLAVTFKPEPGQTLDDVVAVADEAEEFFMERKNVKTVQFSVGGENPMNPGENNSALFFVEYDSETPNFSEEGEKVIELLQKDTEKGEWATQDFSGMGSSGALTVQVYGESMKEIEPIVKEVEKVMKDQDSLKNVESSISESYDEYTLVADQEKLSKLGLSAAQLGMEFARAGQREVITTIQHEGKDVNVYLQVEKETFEDIEDLTDKTIQSPLGMSVPIKELVTIEEGKTSDTITRRDGKIYADVSGEITTKDVTKVSTAVKEKVDKIETPSNVEISMGGVTEDIAESFTQLGLAMLAAIAIVYLVLVVTFGGGLAPFAILFSLPFTVIGALVGLLVSGETISVSAMIGALMLIGIVVTNAIVLIDRVIHMENEGLSTREALLEAAGTRLRPILMTAIATIGALAPLAVGLEGSGLISKGLGVTVIGGLTSSTLLTLLVVPMAYESLMKIKNKLSKKKNKEASL
jgi:hydrophobic/amphiphilic exporter-1 (mainly G- bacteria), HAE1 family